MDLCSELFTSGHLVPVYVGGIASAVNIEALMSLVTKYLGE